MCEVAKQLFLIWFSDPNTSILHGEGYISIIEGNMEEDLAFKGEFDGVDQEVGYDLPNPTTIR